MIDVATKTIVYAVKLTRVMVMWIVLYVVEKAYQDAYVQTVLVRDGKPPRLTSLVLTVVAIEAMAMAALLGVLYLVKLMFKRRTNTFVLDDVALGAAITDYVVGTVIIVALGVLLGYAAENRQLLRYQTDGMRLIRAFCELLLMVNSFVIIALPFYSVALPGL